MAKPIKRKKRNKLAVALLFPIIAIVFIFGWTLNFIGRLHKPKTKQPQKPINKTPAEQDGNGLIINSYEDEQKHT